MQERSWLQSGEEVPLMIASDSPDPSEGEVVVEGGGEGGGGNRPRSSAASLASHVCAR